MATLLLSAAGAAIGSGFGGSVLGLTGAVIGRAVGATLGRVIDQRLLGAGAEAVEMGRVERFRLMGASEGTALAQVYGRTRLAGQVIWATRFLETASKSGGGKGASRPKVTSYSYSLSLALALCEGPVGGIGRIWADGVEIRPSDLNLRLYHGTEDQLPDPKIAAVEGTDRAPAYRGLAYVVIEDLELAPYGNRVPQLSFEVIRPAQGDLAGAVGDLAQAVRAVALIPGTGEYALATTKVHYADGDDATVSANVNSGSGRSDLETSLDQLQTELPRVGSVSLVVSWFGDDLRCGQCQIRPKVEQAQLEGAGMAWHVAGLKREDGVEVARVDGRQIYGGTPADGAVIEAIVELKRRGQEVMFYPFILMEQLPGNALPDPWTGAEGQPPLPWRGRITLDAAPGMPGSADGTAAAAAEVADFLGSAMPGHFEWREGRMRYDGPEEWRYRRFILHYAHLCAAAGGVDAFCIGSEMRALTQIRGAGHSFPAVTALRQLAAEVRAILGPQTRISYAADWSEYFGYHVEADVYFHLDPLWADPNVDFVGIDNYMPLSDWRDGETHADAGWGSLYRLDYLMANVEGGEGHDWYYDSAEAARLQRRRPITDGAHQEPWVFRYKDLRGWWSQHHHDRIGGVRQALPTDWVPGSKPIVFTEYGCAAIDRGANEPNKFLDPKSSESALPKFSDGRRDDLMQMQYLRAFHAYWADPARNPQANLYDGRMIDMARAHVWAWDARPFPAFPNRASLWSDGDNYARGHWLNGRASGLPLAAVVAAICEAAGLVAVDVSDLQGMVRGFDLAGLGTARAALQPLMLAYGFEAVERDGVLRFVMRRGVAVADLTEDDFALSDEIGGSIERTRAPESESLGRVLVGHIEAEADFALREAEMRHPDAPVPVVAQTDLPLVLTRAEGMATAERWLAEARVARDVARFDLPPSRGRFGPGDVLRHEGAHWRIDRVEQGELRLIEATRTEPGLFRPSDPVEERVLQAEPLAEVPAYPVFLDLPLLTGQEVPHAPHVAIAERPWPGQVAVWSSSEDAGYRLNRTVEVSATVGRSQTALAAAPPGLWDRGAALRVKLGTGQLASASETAVLNGANAMAIGHPAGGDWEVFQFTTATLVGPATYDLTGRLRGQLGSDGVMPAEWPVGSQVVLLDEALVQLELAASARGLSRHYRVGRASRSYDDQLVRHVERAFAGVGLRPYRPAHLRATAVGGDLRLTWLRRTRIDGDSWEAPDVPLGEERERYLLRLRSGGVILREETLSAPEWTYGAAQRAADGAGVVIEVAQISASFGPGPFVRLELAP
ncbi:MAG: glycoside hydrolase TIM-barrel-like domain-containing protein [Gemmobacter sp.]|nr:glycoside hydrolase TIM-barrel-like domain-containing protein [Gemmobacter sp.]